MTGSALLQIGRGSPRGTAPDPSTEGARRAPPLAIERLSIELTDRCAKRCPFCYAKATPEGAKRARVDDVTALARDAAANGVRAVSFGGGEPLEFEGVFDLIAGLRGVLFRSMTTNGMLLSTDVMDELARARPDKVHISIHFPDRAAEVARVIRQVHELSDRGLKSGINLLVARSQLDAARSAAARIANAGIGPSRVVYLPMRGGDAPSAREVAAVAAAGGAGPFQSMSCLAACAKSPRFCSIAADGTVAWCSYTRARRPLLSPTYAALAEALHGLDVIPCGP